MIESSIILPSTNNPVLGRLPFQFTANALGSPSSAQLGFPCANDFYRSGLMIYSARGGAEK
jgi:hypothetical protein